MLQIRSWFSGTGLIRYVMLLAGLGILYLISRENYLLFHSIVEVFSIVIAFAIFMFAWNSRHMVETRFFLFLGIAFLFVGGIDFIHTLAYRGMGVFDFGSSDPSIQLWVGARYIQAVSLLLAILLVNRKPKTGLLFTLYLAVCVLVVLSIIHWDTFPSCYIDGTGLTTFKITSEFIISFIMLLAAVCIWRRRDRFSPRTVLLLIVSIAVTILSELSFTLYTDVYGILNIVGHILKFLSFYLIYVAIIETGLKDPFSNLFRNLRSADNDLRYQIEQRNESDRIFRNLVENSPFHTQIYNPGGELIYVNKVGLEIRGFTDMEEYRKTPEQQRLTPESYARTRQWQEDARNGIPLPSPFYIDIVRKDNIIMHLMGFRNEIVWDGEMCTQVTFIDVTEQRTLEEREKQLQEEIIRANRLAAIGQMAAGIAHEINNPLTWMLGYAGLLLEQDLPEDVRNDINLINEGARRVSSITRRMLTFAREREPELTETDINEVIETTLNLRAHDMEVNNIHVELHLDSDLVPVLIDIGQIQQVFLNIILNAEIEMQKAHGGGRLKITTERVDGIIRVSFQDDGPGIPEGNLERIFEPFFTTREVGEGTGLGLSVSYGIIASHEGNLYARSEPGQGATFIVELPVKTGSVPVGKTSLPEEPVRTEGVHILVVDDERLIRAYVTELLQRQGYSVDVAADGEEALRMAESTVYNVVLLDVKLPGYSGIEVYEQLLDRSDTWENKIIFVTGDMMGTDTMSYILSTGVPFIAKPFDASLLLKGIERLLRNR